MIHAKPGLISLQDLFYPGAIGCILTYRGHVSCSWAMETCWRALSTLSTEKQVEAADIITSAQLHRDTSTWLRSIISAPSQSSSTTISTMQQVHVSNMVSPLCKCVSQSPSFQNDFTSGIGDLFSSALTGMVSRLKYIVSTRMRPPSTVGLGYGKSNSSVHKMIC